MRIAPALTALLAFALPALAQDVTVYPEGGGGQTLIDPATGKARYVPPLLQPWQDETIHLRPPGTHKRKHAAKPAATASTAPSSSTDSYTSTAPEPPRPAKKTRHTAVASATPKPAASKPAAKPEAPAASAPSGYANIDLITGGQRLAPVAQSQPAATAAPKPAKTASLEKPKAKSASGTRKDSITFAPNASDPSNAAVSSVRSLANTLSSTMGETGRVQLMAYAGQRGEKSSDTRRMALKRALVIRQLLIDDGVPSDRIDVFALGGTDDDGPLDRVDVFVKG